MQAFPLSTIFEEVKLGDFHVSGNLNAGNIPLISCSAENQGVEGYFNIPEKKTFENAVTIASDGQPLASFYHAYRFAAKDNVLVCIPKKNTPKEVLLYCVAYLNSLRWRFSYGRKCYSNKVDKINVIFPVNKEGEIDIKLIKEKVGDIKLSSIMPRKKYVSKVDVIKIKFKEHDITEIFDLHRGDFHSISNLDAGDTPTVSRTSTNNGVIGHFEAPEGAKKYHSGIITVSTVSGDAFLQLDEFIATDNIVICVPKRKLQLTTLIFIEFMLNRQKWRYSYGRQCYKGKFEQTKVLLPTKKDGKLDEEIMKRFVHNTAYWDYLRRNAQMRGHCSGNF